MTGKESLELVRQNGLALEHVPHELRTPELCLEAVRQNGWALHYVPDDLRTHGAILPKYRQSLKGVRHRIG
jgi:hypothetical protein